ncbi:MAG: hypothetical protein ACRCYE_05080, partial [Sarcina sp.]
MQDNFLLVLSKIHPTIDEKSVRIVTRFPVASKLGTNIEILIITKHKKPINKRNLDVKYMFENILVNFFIVLRKYSLIRKTPFLQHLNL